MGTERRRVEFAVVELGRRRRRPGSTCSMALPTRPRLAEAREQATRRALEKIKAETMARLDVQIGDRPARGRAGQRSGWPGGRRPGPESRRIIRDRYESGLTDAAMLLRAGRRRAAGRCATNCRACECAHCNRDPATSDRKAMKTRITRIVTSSSPASRQHSCQRGVGRLLGSPGAGCSGRRGRSPSPSPSRGSR